MAMKIICLIGLSTLGMVAISDGARACERRSLLDYSDIKYAGAVVVGRVENYRLVSDPEALARYKALLTRSSKLPETFGDIRVTPQFDIVVDEVLQGHVEHRLTVEWLGSNFAVPTAIPPGPYVLALRGANSLPPPHWGPAWTVSKPEAGHFALMQAPCSTAFMFPATSYDADRVRQALKEGTER
ncbi:hypothetical protein AB4Z52_34810 [Rhizobium sp. 2YAF20]|uniref:hypothetical protein n=1 Tax=Rhizobium sp. 2YAF20 TaxID=3233027 RepID=UPI003F95B334